MTANETWELMREITKMNINDLEEIYGTRDPWNVLTLYSSEQAQKELNNWKNRKKIQIGDEVEFDDTTNGLHRTMYVTSRFNKENYCGICKNGDTYCVHKSYLTKTKKHIDFDKVKNLITMISEERQVTNGDKIRAMNDNELANALGAMGEGMDFCTHCLLFNNKDKDFKCIGSCKNNFRDWLNQPVKRSGK